MGVVKIGTIQLLLAYGFVVILLIIVKKRGLSREKEILIASIRMTLQLFITGHALVYIFEWDHFIFTILIILLMEVFAVYNVFKRLKMDISKALKKIVAISIFIGTLSSLLIFLFVIVQVKPWYNPRYFIPIAGMLIGNAMTGISLGISRLVDGFKSQRDLIESSLMLGATKKAASKFLVDQAFDAAILPTINSMVGMGIVFLPGMMTGQILSGISPVTAIEYQIAIMLGILGSVTLTVILFLNLGYKTFYNDKDQLID